MGWNNRRTSRNSKVLVSVSRHQRIICVVKGLCWVDLQDIDLISIKLPICGTDHQIRHAMLSPKCGHNGRRHLSWHPSSSVVEVLVQLTLRLTNDFQDKWSAVYSVQTILLSLQSLLGGTNYFLLVLDGSIIERETHRTKQCLSSERRRGWTLEQSQR